MHRGGSVPPEGTREGRRSPSAGYPVIGDAAQFDAFVEYGRKPPVSGVARELDPGGGKRNCDFGYRSMTIALNGDVSFCDILGPIGNVHSGRLKDRCRGEAAEEQRR